ncbi:conjugal transfer protein TraN, partial [Pseudomonas aeruginosa]
QGVVWNDCLPKTALASDFCQTYTDNPACTLVSHQCAFYSEEGACLHEYATYSCESKTSGKVMVCGGDVFCLDGECDKAQSG